MEDSHPKIVAKRIDRVNLGFFWNNKSRAQKIIGPITGEGYKAKGRHWRTLG